MIEGRSFCEIASQALTVSTISLKSRTKNCFSIRYQRQEEKREIGRITPACRF